MSKERNKIVHIWRQSLTKSVTLALFLLISTPLAGWASSDLTTVRFVVSHRNAILEALPSHVAEAEGLFEKHGVKVEFVSGSGGGSTLRLLSTGDADMAKGGLSAAILAAKMSPNIELISGWFHSAGAMVWIARTSSEIESVTDLAGSKLGYSSAGSASQWLATESIKRAGVPDVSFVAVGGMGTNWTAVKSGVLTAGWAMEPFLSDKITNDNAEVVLDPGNYIDHYYLEGIDVNKSFAQQHPEAVRAVLRALGEAVKFISDHPERAAEIAGTYFDFPESVLIKGIRKYNKNNVWSMKVDPQAFTTVMQGMLDTGLIDQEIDMSKLLNQNYLSENLRTKFKK